MNRVYVYLSKDPAEYRPGEPLAGEVEWQLDKEVRHLQLALLYYTDSQAGQQIQLVEEQTIETPGLAGRQGFTFGLPGSPFSFKGKLIELSWAVEATLAGSKIFDHKTFSLSPTGKSIVLPG